MLYLFYTACSPCTDRLSDIGRLFDDYRGKVLDVALVSIAPMDDERRLLDHLGSISPDLPVFLLDGLDDEAVEEFFLRDWEPVVPSVFFYTSGGRLERFETTAESITYNSLRQNADKLLAKSRKL